MEPSALIFDIAKFAVHDGPGIRTVVFLKGCPLHCLWCHNPESQSFDPEIIFHAGKCTGCGKCASACPRHCHKLENGVHLFEREMCIGCGKCTEHCYAEALKLAGRRMTVSQVLAEVMKDKPFYDNSGGGITLSGGEPLAHYDFSFALLREAKKNGLHTAIETSGFAPQEKISAMLDLVDLWLWDVKAAPPKHQELIGVPSDLILNNLRFIDEHDAKIILRCPLVPEINDEDAQLLQISELANTLNNVQRIDLEPYHPLGEAKCEKLGREASFRSSFASEERKKHWTDFLKQQTSVPVHI